MTAPIDGLVTAGTRPHPRLSRTRLGQPRLSQTRLSRIVADTAAHPERWRDLVRYDPARRWYHRIELSDDHEVWLLTWHPGQGTGFHDHGGSRGAFAVALGELHEQSVLPGRLVPELAVRTITAGQARSFGPRFIHHVVNNSARNAISVHAYSPPLPEMRRYELTPAGLRYTGTEPAETRS
jgi:predicted metal-dependent enzyme (double-stranded beta helix superfamily)